MKKRKESKSQETEQTETREQRGEIPSRPEALLVVLIVCTHSAIAVQTDHVIKKNFFGMHSSHAINQASKLYNLSHQMWFPQGLEPRTIVALVVRAVLADGQHKAAQRNSGPRPPRRNHPRFLVTIPVNRQQILAIGLPSE